MAVLHEFHAENRSFDFKCVTFRPFFVNLSHFRPVGRKKFILHRFFQKSSSNTPIDHGEHSDSRNKKNDFEPPMNRKRHDILQRDVSRLLSFLGR